MPVYCEHKVLVLLLSVNSQGPAQTVPCPAKMTDSLLISLNSPFLFYFINNFFPSFTSLMPASSFRTDNAWYTHLHPKAVSARCGASVHRITYWRTTVFLRKKNLFSILKNSASVNFHDVNTAYLVQPKMCNLNRKNNDLTMLIISFSRKEE